MESHWADGQPNGTCPSKTTLVRPPDHVVRPPDQPLTNPSKRNHPWSGAAQVSKASEADRIEKLGVSRVVGLILVAAWLIVLICTIVFRRRTDYESRKELHWWEAFYRTGSIIFGGGQVKRLCSIWSVSRGLHINHFRVP